jgi:large subunit ribosomal protein L3
MKFILAKKIGMTTIYSEDGIAHNVTLLDVGKNVVTLIRKAEKDGYAAVQVGYLKEGSKKNKDKLQFEKKREFRLEEGEESKYKLEQEIGIDKFEIGEKVNIAGTSKGKGFQGVVKRHGFSGSPASHGHRHDLRAPGSIGSAFPERVLKGKKMAGRMGSERVMVKNLEIVYLDEDKSLLAVKGAVPGNNSAILEVVSSQG